MKDYDTVLTEAETEFTEKRSRFICAIRPVTTPEEAMAFIAERPQLQALLVDEDGAITTSPGSAFTLL